MSAVAQLLRADLLKLRTTRSTWLLLGAMALVTLALVALALRHQDAADLAGARGVHRVLTIGGVVACFFTLALGVVGMASEYRHGTIGQALLAAPARWPVVVAKVAAYAAAGLLFGIVALAMTFAVGVPGLAAKDAGIAHSGAALAYAVLGTLVSGALFAVIGVGLAALLRDQALALSAGLGWMLLVDSVALSLAPGLGRFFPGGALASLLHSHSDDMLPAGFAALVLVAYAAIFATAGALVARRHDLT